MIDTLRQKSENVFELKAGTLYPLLHGLEEKGLLRVYEKSIFRENKKVLQYYEAGMQSARPEGAGMENICQGCWKCIRVMCFGGIADGKVFAGSVRTDSL